MIQPAEHQKDTSALMAEFIGEVTEETALNKFILAGFYEDNQLFIDAITVYEENYQPTPDVDTYREAMMSSCWETDLKIMLSLKLN